MPDTDTFNALKPIPFKQMVSHWVEEDKLPLMRTGRAEIDGFFKQYGWTYDKFWNEFNRNLSKVNNQDAVREALEERVSAQVQRELVAWESPRNYGLKRFVSDHHYLLYSPAVQRFYKPFKCSNCQGTEK